MKAITEIFTRKKNGSDLDRTLDAIIAVEKKRDEAKLSLDAAKQALNEAFEKEITTGGKAGDEEKLTAAVVAAQGRFDAAESLLQKAFNEGLSVIAAGSKERAAKVKELEEKVATIRRAIDLRRATAIAEFCTTNGLTVAWPTRNNGGHVALPAMALDPGDYAEVEQQTTDRRVVDPQAGELTAAQDELARVNVLLRSAPDLALKTVLEQRRQATK